MMGGGPEGGPGGMRGGPGLRQGPGPVTERRSVGFRAIASLTVPAYRLYFLFVLGQMGAMNMQMMARSWYVYELSKTPGTNDGSVTMLGAVALANGLPMLTLSLFGGVLADRVPKKQVLIVGQIMSTVITVGVAMSITLGSITVWHLLIASFLQGIVMALMMPARQAIIPELVSANMITNAVALNGAAMNLLRLMGPALAGFLIALWDIEGVYYIMALLYGSGVLILMGVPLTGAVALRGSGMLKQVGEGLSYVRHNSPVLLLLIFSLFSFVLSMPYMFLLPAFTDTILTVDPSRLTFFTSLPMVGTLFDTLDESSARQGLLISISGIGALIGSIFVATMEDKKRGLWLLISMFVMATSLIVFSFTNSYLIAFIVFIPLGFAQAGRMALSNTLAQVYSDDEHRGRVMSIYMLNWAMTNFGVFFVGVLADVVGTQGGFSGAQIAVGGSAILLLAVTIFFTVFVKRLRELD
ncbi:MAG: MFS transporter [Dehalococcoidia bacterium]|nr:MFS transporter [Dehalococcoidia bacterium]